MLRQFPDRYVVFEPFPTGEMGRSKLHATLMRAVDEHNLKVCGNAFDFCLLDTTSYDEYHNEDLCCLQVCVEL